MHDITLCTCTRTSKHLQVALEKRCVHYGGKYLRLLELVHDALELRGGRAVGRERRRAAEELAALGAIAARARAPYLCRVRRAVRHLAVRGDERSDRLVGAELRLLRGQRLELHLHAAARVGQVELQRLQRALELGALELRQTVRVLRAHRLRVLLRQHRREQADHKQGICARTRDDYCTMYTICMRTECWHRIACAPVPSCE